MLDKFYPELKTQKHNQVVRHETIESLNADLPAKITENELKQLAESNGKLAAEIDMYRIWSQQKQQQQQLLIETEKIQNEYRLASRKNANQLRGNVAQTAKKLAGLNVESSVQDADIAGFDAALSIKNMVKI